jgi:ADP-ribose pyrophosphatase YjhB (NUDIX family)
MQEGYAKKHWVEPGGKTNCVLENVEEAVFREVEEETGLQREELKLMQVWPMIRGSRPKHYFIFEVDVHVAEAAVNRLRRSGGYMELDPLRWFDFHRAVEGNQETSSTPQGGVIHESTRNCKILQDLHEQLFPRTSLRH